ncbi:MAG TPA: hypothetical protein VM734_14875 [Kofleriaceae bacterium]|nr:hypothetical protein [Kofleriaceae bacterium]
MTGRQLLAWGDLDERRRRRGPIATRMLVAGVAGLALAAEAARRAGWFDGGGVRGVPSAALLIAIALAGLVPAMFGAPYRMFWRHDAPLLARLPIAGGALWFVAVVRAARATASGVLVVVPTLVVAALGDAAVAARAAALVGALAAAAIALLPAVCLGAAHVVASGKAHDLAASVGGGEVPLPTTSVLGALPGAVIAGVVLAAIFAAPWVGGRVDATGPIILAVLASVAVLAALAATAAAPRVYPLAMREVAALDRQIYAHLEIDPITAVERAIKGRLAEDARPVYDRMARLVRRRYPLVAFAGVAAAITYIAVGFVGPGELAAWLGATAAVQGFLAAWLLRALTRPPLELPRLTATLPVTPSSVASARRAYVAGWSLVWFAVPAAVAIAASGRPATAALALAIGFAGAGTVSTLTTLRPVGEAGQSCQS